MTTKKPTSKTSTTLEPGPATTDRELLEAIHRQLTEPGGVGNPTILARLQAVESALISSEPGAETVLQMLMRVIGAVTIAGPPETPSLYQLVDETRRFAGTPEDGHTAMGELVAIRSLVNTSADQLTELQGDVAAVQSSVGTTPDGRSVIDELGTVKDSVGVGRDSVLNKVADLKIDVGVVQTSVGSPRGGRSVLDELGVVKTSVGVDEDSVLNKIAELKIDVGVVQTSVGGLRDGRSVLDELSIVKTSVGIDDGSVLNKIAELKADVGAVQTSVNTGTASVLDRVLDVKGDVATVQVSVDNGTVTVLDQVDELKGDVGAVKASVGTGATSVLARVTDVQSTVIQQLLGGPTTLRADVSVIKSIVTINDNGGIAAVVQGIASAVGATQGATTNHTLLTKLHEHFHVGMDVPFPTDPQY